MSAAPGELVRALGSLAEPPAPEHGAVARALGLPEPAGGAAYADLFLFHLHPYASVHVGPEGMLGGEARARVAGFWRAVGREPPVEPDHLSALLGLYGALLDEAAAAPSAEARLVERAAVALLHEHVACWIFPFLARVAEMGDPFQRAWAGTLREVLAGELRRALPVDPTAGAEGGSDPAGEAGRGERTGSPGDPGALPLHLRVAPGLRDPRAEGAAAFVAGLLAPVRSGLTLTRADVARVAAGLGAGLRAGERRYALEHLLGQEPRGALAALAAIAEAAAERHAADDAPPPAVARFWADRARASTALLRALEDDVGYDALSGTVARGARGEVPPECEGPEAGAGHEAAG